MNWLLMSGESSQTMPRWETAVVGLVTLLVSAPFLAPVVVAFVEDFIDWVCLKRHERRQPKLQERS